MQNVGLFMYLFFLSVETLKGCLICPCSRFLWLIDMTHSLRQHLGRTIPKSHNRELCPSRFLHLPRGGIYCAIIRVDRRLCVYVTGCFYSLCCSCEDHEGKGPCQIQSEVFEVPVHSGSPGHRKGR